MKKYINLLLSLLLLMTIACSNSSDVIPKPNPDDNNNGKPVKPPVPKVHYLPIVKISTVTGQQVQKETYIDALITIESRDEDGKKKETLYQGETEIKGRGNSTWGADKKPYRLKLKSKSEILGMPSNKHWVLLANHFDKTFMRNEIAFEISRRMGFAYTPRMKYVDVQLDGKYLGNYMLGEHIRIDKNRINIAEDGGYFLEIDNRDGKYEPQPFWTKIANTCFVIKDPENISAEQSNYIKNHIQKIEDAIYRDDKDNVMNELNKYIDIKSFIDYYILNELTKNPDGNLRLSTFLYKNSGNEDKVYWGPVWDYDISFGNGFGDSNEPGYHTGFDKPAGWYVKHAPWYEKLFMIPEFKTLIQKRWNELYKLELVGLDLFIDEIANQLDESQKRNFEVWDINQKHWNTTQVAGSYKGEVKYFKSWLSTRIEWMNKEL